MDLEFYARQALGLKTPDAKVQPIEAPRTLDVAFASRSLAAVESTLAPALSMTPSALRDAASARRKAVAIEYNRVLSSGAFGIGGYDALEGGSSGADAVTQQYAFDLTLLTLFSLLADARLPRETNADVARRLGDSLIEVVGPPSAASPASAAAASSPKKLSELIDGMRTLLRSLRTAGYVRAFTLDDSDADDALWAQRSELSDTRLTVTLTESASLRAGVVLNGRSGCSPELARPLLIAYLRQRGVLVESSEYFLDDTYRSNPQEYRANQQVIELTLKPA